VLWRCWLGVRKGIQPVKKLQWWGSGVVICLERGADLRSAQLIPLPLTVSCFGKIQIGFTFLVGLLAYPGSPEQRAVKRVCVYYQITKFYSVCLKLWKSYAISKCDHLVIFFHFARKKQKLLYLCYSMNDLHAWWHRMTSLSNIQLLKISVRNSKMMDSSCLENQKIAMMQNGSTKHIGRPPS